ncbi:hypothetical protein KAS08_05135 [Candidatus Pacearchaeota archaeon]|nr:hypothetical protein [Candidatus Pacearchaeota archaeon]
MEKEYIEFREKAQPFLKGLRSPDYEIILKTFFERRSEDGGIPARDIPLNNGVHSKIKALCENKRSILELTTSGNSRKMLVSLDFREIRPCFGGEAANTEAAIQGNKLINHAEENPSIKETIFSVFGNSDWDEISEFIRNFLFTDFHGQKGLGLFNNCIRSIKERGLYLSEKGYGILEWRPYSVQKFRIKRHLI